MIIVGVLAVDGCSDDLDQVQPSIKVAPSIVPPGGKITVSIDGVSGISSEELDRLREGRLVIGPNSSNAKKTTSSIKIGDDGSFTEQVQVPSKAVLGTWTVSWDVPCNDNSSCAGITGSFTVK